VLGYIVRRLIQAVIVVIGVTIIAFILQNLVATGPALARAVIGLRAGPTQVHAFIKEYGLNSSLPVQYEHFFWQMLHGNLGYSYKLSDSVDALIAHDLPRDLLLVGSSLVISLLIAIPVGLVQAANRNRLVDYIGTGVSFVLYSMPYFLLGLLLIAVFSVSLGLLPAEAPQGTTITQVLSQPTALILPIATLALGNYALFSQYMRSAAVENLAQDYVRTARAKGASKRRILWLHVLRNSLLSVVTLVGLSVPAILTLGFVVEYVFNFPGTGLLFYNAAVNADYPVELGITILVSVATVFGNLAADIAYAVLDPQVRYTSERRRSRGG
jgi:peptide/nickel transport system permease protein